MHVTETRSSGAPTIAVLLQRAAEGFAERVALTTLRDGEWIDVTYAEVGTIVQEIALGLLDLGLAKGDRVAMLASTRPEWTYADFAASTAGATVVPIYPTNTPEECEWILADSGSRMVICENAAQVAKIRAIRDRLPALEHVLVIDADTRDEKDDTISIDKLRGRAKYGDTTVLQGRASSVSPTDIYTIVYTSGTTGRPKGCMLSHRNFRAVLDALEGLRVVRPDDVSYLFLPLAHVMSLLQQLLSVDMGAKLAYFGDATKILDELRVVRPTYFPSVPRLFEKIYAATAPSIEADLGKDRFNEIVALGVRVRDLEYTGQEVPDELRRAWDPVNEKVFGPVRAIFGGRVREAATGGAPIDKHMLEFFYAAGIPVLEAYGMTETATAITTSTPERHRFGTVGCPVPGVEVRIADDGEILVKGGNVFEGYHNNEKASAEVLVDGWLHTGDLGSIDDDGYLSITGRKKDIIITAGGKNLTPANLENDIQRCRYVSHAIMHGDRRPFPTMLITLDPEEIVAWARQHGKPQDVPTLSRDPDVIALIQSALDESNSRYASVGQVKKFFILDHELSHETGELTPTLKVKRSVVEERYRALFDALY